jgi:hypothetical protein
MKLGECLVNIKKAIKKPPKMQMVIQNYHWEEKVHKFQDGTTRKEKKKVYTKECKAPFAFTQWIDRSPPPENLDYVDTLHLTRLFTHKLILMSSAAFKSY